MHPEFKLKIYRLTVIGMMICFMLAGRYKSIWILVAITSAAVIAAVNDALVMGDLHHHTDSNARATMESMYSMIHRLFSIGVGLIFAYLSDQVDVLKGFTGIAYLLVIGWIVLSMLSVFTSVKEKMSDSQRVS
jgi:hypothetical protein